MSAAVILLISCQFYRFTIRHGNGMSSDNLSFGGMRDVSASEKLRLLELALVLVRLDHVASAIGNANRGIL